MKSETTYLKHYRCRVRVLSSALAMSIVATREPVNFWEVCGQDVYMPHSPSFPSLPSDVRVG